MTKKEGKKIETKKQIKEVKKINNKSTSTKDNTKTKKTTKTIKKDKKHFINDVKSELKKVRWPLKKEMIKYSMATLMFMLILGLFFVATDLIIAGIRMVFI